MPDASWLDHAITLVRQTVPSGPEPRTAGRRLGTVNPVGDQTSGWYAVDRPLITRDLELLSDGQLSRGTGARALSYDVLEVVAEEGQPVRVRVSVSAPREQLAVTVPNAGMQRIRRGLAESLERSMNSPLLAQFAQQQLTPVSGPDLSRIPGWPSLKPAQQEAVRACASPGLQLVWGPPGTGKTHVIARAISHLATSGRRVLLVSNTNVAVDNAFAEVLPMLEFPPRGTAVRVGYTELSQLRDNDDVQLGLLVEARQAEMRDRVDRLGARLEQLAAPGERLERVQTQLAGFDPNAYQQAHARNLNRHQYLALIARLGPAEADLRQARLQAQDAERLRLADVCREAITTEEAVRRYFDAADAAVTDHANSSVFARASHPGAKRRLLEAKNTLLTELAEATSRRRRAVEAAQPYGAYPYPADLADSAGIAAYVTQTQATLGAATTRLAQLKDHTERVTQSGLSTPAEEQLVVAEQSRWQLHQTVPELTAAAQQADRQRGGAQRDYDQALKQLRQQRRQLEKEIVGAARVVATTVAQIALHPWLTATQFDHVIIDEVAATPLPHVMHAISQATAGAVMVGDYLQNGPIADTDLPGPAEAKQLFGRECFTHFQATNPMRARDRPGCVILTEQFRFGPALTELANRVAYGGILTTAGRGDADIIVIAADGLPEDITAVHRLPKKQAGWWLIGALMARALAEHHYDGGARDAFGVVAPYTAQVDATRAALEDSSLGRSTEVGTATKFQGRQFQTVLADLVEDGNGRMVQADLNGNDYAVDSVRVFNVAATRPKSRLYVLVGRGALERTRTGPLAALRQLIAGGQAHRIDADQLLGLFQDDPPVEGSPEADLVAALSPYVRVAGLHDEDEAIDEVVARIDDAQDSVWCWSAWVGRYAASIIDALERAHQRGVSVHVMARPEREVNPAARESLALLTRRLPRVVFMRSMHQKIVVVDRQWSIVGSMNTLSHGKTSSSRIRDVMVTMDGSRFAERLLTHELTEELSQTRWCPTCREPLMECGLVGSGNDRGWAWVCHRSCAQGNAQRLPFPAQEVQRPQRKPGDRHGSATGCT